jgi:polyisoprenoid-binding protein YceI
MNRVLILAFLISFQAHSQSRFEIVSSQIDFSSDAALEVIKASTEKTNGIIDPKTKQFAFIVNTASFKGFNSELQRQHFNEKYMESEKYFQSTFSGVILDSVKFYVDGTYKVQAKGSLLIHGKKQPRTIPATITVSKGKLNVQSDFKILLADHDISVPKVVNQKVATEILVKLNFIMAEKKK